MTLHLGWDHMVLVGFLVLLIFWLGALAEYIWHAYRHRHH